MTFAEEVGAFRFRLFGPRFGAATDRAYRLPRPDGSSATLLESRELAIESNNVYLGPVEAERKRALRDLSALPKASTLACGAVVNAAVRHMPEELAFVTTRVGDGFLFLSGMLGNDRRTCIGIDRFDPSDEARFRAQFDAHRSDGHSFINADWRECLRGVVAPAIGVLLHNAGDSYHKLLKGLRSAEPLLADKCLIVFPDANENWCRRAAVDFARDSLLDWRVVLDERTSGDHPTVWNGLMVMEAGDGPERRVEIATETGIVDPVDLGTRTRRRHPPSVTVIHYRNPWVAIQDYPDLENIALDADEAVRAAFEGSAGDYVVVLDADVELPPSALSEAVRHAEDGIPQPSSGGLHDRLRPVRDSLGSLSALSRRWRPLADDQLPHRGTPPGRYSAVEQADYHPSWNRTFDDRDDPQTVTVARELSVTRDNLVALDLDLNIDDVGREIFVRFSRGLRLEGPAARCSRVPEGVVAGRAGAVLTPDGRWLIESVGTTTRAWPDLTLDDDGRVAIRGALQESDDCVATIVCERRREWTTNFGHWTFDALTRVAMLLRAGVPDDVKVLVPQPVLPFQRETLNGLGIADERIVPWSGGPTRFREVYVPTARLTPPFVFPAGIELLRQLGESIRVTTPRTRLFVSRRQLTRTVRIRNEEELLGIAVDYGFAELAPETLPYSEQLRRFSEAEIVVGAHGSGLANASFMARGTGLCELAPARLNAAKVPNFWDLAACGGQRYGLCVGSRRIDPKRFRRVIRDMVQSVRSDLQ